MISAADEGLRLGDVRGAVDAVTVAFADPRAGLFGLARLGVARAGDAPRASGLAVLFEGARPAAVLAAGDVDAGPAPDWGRVEVPGLGTGVGTPLAAWSVRFEDAAGRGFALDLEALSPPAELSPGDAAGGGLRGYEQLCRVRGEVRANGRPRRIEALGQRGHLWGVPDWDRLALTRTVSAWLDDGEGVTLAAARPAGARGHEDEATWSALLSPEEAALVDDARLSTTYDGEGRQRRAGLELWVREEDGVPRRAAGEVVCGSTLELGELRLDSAFLRWRMDGRPGAGRYDILRRAAG